MHQISDSELIIMKIIWKHNGQAMYAQITEALEGQGLDWKKNTILTFLSRLVEKQLLKIHKVGRRNYYIAIVDEEDYQTWQTKSFVGKVYEGNVKGLVSTLVEQHLISSDEVEELRRFWDEKES